jgi:flavin reductase (DIM6/NTAB) family NADH-FMN oxidoreductase RutF
LRARSEHSRATYLTLALDMNSQRASLTASIASSPYLTSAVVDNAVALVTSFHQGQSNVMTVTHFAESSHLPVLLRVAINTATFSFQLVRDSGWFGLSILGDHQAGLALACGTTSGREVAKFAQLGLRYRAGPFDVPLLPDCLTTSVCKVVEEVALDDHMLFVGEIIVSYRQTALAYRRALLLSDLTDYLSPRATNG